MASSDIVLAIDNSIDYLNLGLARDGSLLEERHSRPVRPSSQVLPLKVQALLDDHGLSPADLTLLAVSLGPGSFTGIRVSLAYAKGLAAALGLPLVGVPTLDLLAWPFTGLMSAYICPLIDAKKGEVFFAGYSGKEGSLERVTDYEALRPGDLAERLMRPCIVFGSGVKVCERVLAGMEDVTVLDGPHGRVQAEGLIRLGLQRKGPGTPAASIRPVYGRRSEAEVKFNLTVT